MGIILGIDYGDKRIGLALSDPESKLARRFLTLNNDIKTFSELNKLIIENKVEKVIIGLPLSFNGESIQTRRVRGFIRELEETITIPIKKMNEVLTSKIAEENLRGAGVKDIKEVIDQEAARIILQDYLESQNKS
jgi:putative Holliday junction resolvase